MKIVLDKDFKYPYYDNKGEGRMIKFAKKKCLKCGAEWVFRVEKPIYCPRCKNPKWNEPKSNKGNN